MYSNIIFLISLLIKLISSKESNFELNIDTSKQFTNNDFTNHELYIFSKNTISGIYMYDIDSPVTLNLSFGLSDAFGNKDINFEGGHNENITKWKTAEGYEYFFSIPVKVSDNDKFTVLKLMCDHGNNCINEGKNINVKLVANYTWKISIFVLFFFLIIIGAIFATCYFARNCLTKCCNFMKVNE